MISILHAEKFTQTYRSMWPLLFVCLFIYSNARGYTMSEQPRNIHRYIHFDFSF